MFVLLSKANKVHEAALKPGRAAAGKDSTLLHVLRDPWLLIIVLAAFLIRVGYNLALHPAGHAPASFVIDEREYFGAAHMLVEGRGFEFYNTALWVRPPLFVLLLAGVQRLAGLDYVAPLILQSLLGAFTLLPLAWVGRRLGGRRASLATALLGAIYLPSTLFAGLLLSETLFIFLFSYAFVALIYARESRGRPALIWATCAGLLLGLAILTRATALLFVPVAALWLFLPFSRHSLRRHGYVLSLVLVAAAILTLVPWTVRNYAAYGHFVAVDTTGGYNLWLASVGVRDEARLQADLKPIANPVDKQSFAYAAAWNIIKADPVAFITKGVKESLDLWKPSFSAEERQVKGYSLGRVQAWHLVSLFLFDDLLYLAVLVMSAAGLIFTTRSPLKSLTLLWMLLWVALAFIFFAVTRFRLPVVVALLPWAGAGLFHLDVARLLGVPRARLAAWVLVSAAAIFLVGLNLPVEETSLGIARWGEQEPFRQAEALLATGHADDALGLYMKANTTLADTRYGIAAAYLQKGDPSLALSELTGDEPPDRYEPFVIQGDAARQSGNLDAARSSFNARPVQVAAADALEWAWSHLNPAPVDNIALGSGLDVGYVRGFYGTETADGKQFRWSSDHAEVRGLKPVPQTIEWSGWRPANLAMASVTLGMLHGPPPLHKPIPLTNNHTWVSLSTPGGDPDMSIDVNPFIGSGDDPRLLGLRVSRIGAAK
ncbi:MAG: glycosyltransferase family 39 protein [Chloroflexota bacterium]|nr:glycosyltransferase family 39 protein [Chloroflexota bacterium]